MAVVTAASEIEKTSEAVRAEYLEKARIEKEKKAKAAEAKRQSIADQKIGEYDRELEEKYGLRMGMLDSADTLYEYFRNVSDKSRKGWEYRQRGNP